MEHRRDPGIVPVPLLLGIPERPKKRSSMIVITVHGASMAIGLRPFPGETGQLVMGSAATPCIVENRLAALLRFLMKHSVVRAADDDVLSSVLG
jgi:hypothetical protein